VAQGLHKSYNDCPKEEDTSYKMQRPPHSNLTAHTAKIIAKILRRRIERKIEDVPEEDQFGFRRGKVTKDVIGMIRIRAERTLEIDEELCICFIDWQKAFEHVNWTKLMQILKRTGINWRKTRVISKLYMDQRFKVQLD